MAPASKGTLLNLIISIIIIIISSSSSSSSISSIISITKMFISWCIDEVKCWLTKMLIR